MTVQLPAVEVMIAKALSNAATVPGVNSKVDTSTFWYWLTHLNWSDRLGILGLTLTVFGFYLTIREVNKAKNEIAVIREDIDRSNSIGDLSYVMSQLEDLVQIAGASKWIEYQPKSSSVSTKLSAFKNHPNIGSKLGAVERIISDLVMAETRVLTALDKGGKVHKPHEIVKVVVESRNEVSGILASLNHEVGRK